MNRILALTALIVLTAANVHSSGVRKKLWDLKLSRLVHPERSDEATPPEPVWGLGFSPDESKLAIGLGQHFGQFTGSRGHVLIVSVTQPKNVLHRSEVGPVPFGFANLNSSISWSPSGNFLVIGESSPTIVHLAENSCSFPDGFEFKGFLSDDRIVLSRRSSLREGSQSEIQVLTPECGLLDSWQWDAGTRIERTCSGANLLAVRSIGGTNLEPVDHGLKVISYPSRDAEQHWTDANVRASAFADECRVVCGSYDLPKLEGSRAACWDIGTGAKIAEDRQVSSLYNGIASSGGDFLAMTDYSVFDRSGRIWRFLDMAGTSFRPKRQVIWNFRTGKELASWSPSEQKYALSKDYYRSDAFGLSLSGSGRYLAEAGAGEVWVYAIQEHSQ